MAALLLLVHLAGCGAEPAAPDSVFYTLGTGMPQEYCPAVADLVRTDQDDAENLRKLAPAIIREIYSSPGYEEYTDLTVAMAADAGLHGEMVKNWCGEKVAASSWVVKMTFPRNAPSASMSAGQFMVSKTRKGWQVWYRYH